MKRLVKITAAVILTIVLLTCKKTDLPQVTTESVSEITQTSAKSGGEVINNGGEEVTVRGICWSTDQKPTINSNKTSDGSGNGSFISIINGLTANTVYYVRAYSTNSEGIGYGDEVSFKTNPVLLASLTTSAITATTSTTAVSGGEITDDGGSTIIERGVCWNTTPNPTIENYFTIDGTGAGSFASNLINLVPGVTYFVRAYATNSAGTVYANEISFTTLCASPSVTTNTATNTGSSTVTLNATINPNNSSTTVIFEYGVTIDYGSSIPAAQSPIAGNSNTDVSAAISSLTPNSVYHFRIKAVNCGGTITGSDQTFQTTCELITAPVIGAITQPTCSIATGSAVLSGLPSAGTWTITRTPGGTTTTETGTNITIPGLASGTYTFTVTNNSGCVSAASGNVVINTPLASPSVPVIGTITQPTCAESTGSVALSGLPSIGTWTLTRTPGGTTTTGTGTSTTISTLAAGTYAFTVTNASGCVSAASEEVVINTQPSTPTAPIVGTITQSTCTLATGSVTLSGLPASGSWTLTRTPGSTTTGTGTSSTISGIPAGSYTFMVTNASGCISAASGDVVINTQPTTPAAPVIGTITQPQCPAITGTVVLSGLPSTGTWTLTRTPGAATTTGSGANTTISGLAAGSYTFIVTNASGCLSEASAIIMISPPPGPSLATTNSGTNIDNTTATLNGTVNANGSSATVTFDYGLTTNLESSIAAIPSPVTGSSNIDVSAVITGLTPIQSTTTGLVSLTAEEHCPVQH